MHPKLRTGLGALALVAVSAAATTAVVLPQATAQVSESATPAPQLVQGLPDFTLLVDRVGPAVVNIDATHEAKPARTAAYPDEDQIPEIFRRFFGPGMPFPMPGPGSRMPSVSQGSGFIISTDGYVLTNHHVIDGADEVTVKLSDSREFTAKVVGSDEKSDVALLKIDAKGLPTLRVGDSHQLKPGQWVVAIGSPFGLDHSVTAGIVSAVGRSNRFADQQYVPFIQTDVAINRGNSGGPLLNTRGEVVGINSQIFRNSGGYMVVSFAIPIDMAMNVVQHLKETGKVQYGMIGVGLQAITREIADGMGLPDTRGALIRNVNPGTPGDKAGLQAGDVIRSVDGRAVNSSAELPPIIGALPPGTKVRLGILRDGKSRNVDVVLAPLDDALFAGPGDDDATPALGRAAPAQAASNPLGLVVKPVDKATRARLDIDDGRGVQVTRIEGAAARRLGVAPGDVILRAGRSDVASQAQLDKALAGAKPGETVMLLVNRGGVPAFVAVKVPEAD